MLRTSIRSDARVTRAPNRKGVVISAKKLVENAPALFGVSAENLQSLLDDTDERKPRGEVILALLRGASKAAAAQVVPG